MKIYNHIIENLRNISEWITEIIEDGYDITDEEKIKLNMILSNLKDLLDEGDLIETKK